VAGPSPQKHSLYKFSICATSSVVSPANSLSIARLDIQIGLSCSSATMRLADEVVSFHAAAAARRLRPYLAKDGPSRQEGAVCRSFPSEDGDSLATTQIFPPTVVLGAGAGWQIRIAAGVAV
jgi:hypothetical protein